MSLGQNSVSIPTDLITEVFSRLPYKSIARFRCVSKLWGSIPLTTPYFTELFLTRTYARSRLLFLVEQFDGYSFYSSPQPQYPYGKSSSSSSLVVKADFHMKFHGARLPEICGLVSGFIYIRQDWISHTKLVPLICNPTTRQYAVLPFLEGITYHPRSFLGFDHVDKQFKILTIDEFVKEEDRYKILTLGTEKDSWRKIHCPFDHYPSGDGTCINGVLYYFVGRVEKPYVIVCFDVRSERFKFVHLDFAIPTSCSKLVNYKGKLGVITKRYDYSGLTLGKVRSLELCIWVMKDDDVEEPKSKWLQQFSVVWGNVEILDTTLIYIVGVTATGKVVLSLDNASKPFYVCFFDPERKTVQRIKIQGLGDNHIDRRRGFYSIYRVYAFVGHVENLKFFDMLNTVNAGTSVTSEPEHKRESTSTSTSSRARLQTVFPFGLSPAQLRGTYVYFEYGNRYLTNAESMRNVMS